MQIVDQIIDLALTACHHHRHNTGGNGNGSNAGDRDSHGSTGNGRDGSNTGGPGTDTTASSAGGARMRAMSPAARDALRYAIARLAVEFLSGSGGLAGLLRTSLLTPPYSTPSLPLDVGYSDDIPAHIRRAVTLRDRHCAWPRCDRPASYCDVHHIVHKQDGGTTSLSNCILLCQFHHDICIHRRNWQITLHPDGTTTARSPDGRQILRSHAPPLGRAS